MKGITITSIAALLAISLAACGQSRIGSEQGEKDSAGGSNATQSDNRPTPGAQDVKPQVTNTQGAKQPPTDANSSAARGDKQRVNYAKQQGKGAKRSMAKTQQCVRPQGECVELQIVETRDVDQVVIDVRQPAEEIEAQPVEVIEQPVAPTVIEEIEAQSVEVIEQSVAPTVIVDTYDTIVRPQTRTIYQAAPAYTECPTVYEEWVEVSDP